MPLLSTGFTWDSWNPLQPGILATEKAVRAIALLFAALSCCQLAAGIYQVTLMRAAIKDAPSLLLVYGLTYSLLPLATMGYWQRKAWGWMLLVACLVFVELNGISAVWFALVWKPSGIAGFDTLYARPSLAWALVRVLGVSLLLYRLTRADCQTAFSVSAGQRRATIGLALLLGLASSWLVLGSGV